MAWAPDSAKSDDMEKAGTAEKAGDMAMMSSSTTGDEVFSKRVSRIVGDTVSRRPCAFLSSCCLGIWALVVICVASGAAAFSEDGPKDWSILSDETTESKDAIELAQQQVDCLSSPDPCPEVAERSKADFYRIGMVLMYQNLEDGDIFTPENLQQMCKVERLFSGSAAYPDFCPLLPGASARVRGNASGGESASFKAGDCQPQSSSAVELFYRPAGMDPAECGLLPAAAVNATSSQLYMGLASPATFQQSGFFLGSDAVSGGTWTGGRTRLTRSLLQLGYPLHGRIDIASDLGKPEVSIEYQKGFYQQLEEDILDFFGQEHAFLRSAYWNSFVVRNLEVVINSAPYFSIETRRAVDLDMMFCIFSIIFVYGYLSYHTGSLFIGAISLFQIVMSIPVCLVFYRYIFQITYYRQLHGLLIFIILGVGADDVFVFSDAWRQSEDVIAAQGIKLHDKREVLAAKIAYAYRHTMVTVLNTSLTTGVAFLSTATSPIMPIRSMGVYACLLVLCNYVFCITLTPAAFAVRECYLLSACSCCRRQIAKVGDEAASGAEGSETASSEAPGIPEGAQTPAPTRRRSAVLQAQSSQVPFFIRRIIIPFFKIRFAAPASAALLIAWGIANIIFTSQLQPPIEAFTFFADEHMVQRGINLNREGFAAGAAQSYNTLTVSFGIAGVDRDQYPGVDIWAPHKWYGAPVYDSAFDLSGGASQQFLREFCQNLREARCDAEGCQPSGKLVLQTADAVSCFIEDFDAWNGQTRYEGAEFTERFRLFRQSRANSMGIDRVAWEQSVGLVDGELRYVQVRAKMTLLAWQGDKIKEPVLDRLEEFLDRERARAPATMASILQTVPIDWVLLRTSQGLIQGLFTGFAICFPVAFLVLLVATSNVYMAFLALCTVGMIVGCVLGYCYMAGWALGAGECIAGIIVIGLAVDYVIHLGHMYLEAKHLGLQTRQERWEFAFNTMGATIIAGAMTTLFAGLVMQFCQLVFFNQMSTLMVLTIVYSWMYTVCCFMAALYVIGPEHDQGDISWVWEKIWPSRNKH